MSAHTPGPWTTQDTLSAMQVAPVGYPDAPVALIYQFRSKPKMAEANARLIAAAPEMLEMLRSFVGCFDGIEPSRRTGLDATYYSARALLAKIAER